jgi:spermidine/putrescine-binding protein
MSIYERRMNRRDALRAGAAGTLGLYLAACGGGSEQVAQTGGGKGGDVTLNWLTWADHYLTEPDQLGEIKQKTGIAARPQLFSDNSDAYLKVKQTGDQFDIVSGDAHDEGLVESFDLDAIPASKQLYSVAKEVDFWQDGSNYMGYPLGWSSILIFYNPKYVDPAPTSWEVLTDPKYKGRIAMENQPTDVTAFAGRATGAKDPYDQTADELKRSGDFLRAVKPNVQKLVAQNQEAVRGLTDESIWIATGNFGYDARVKDAGGPEIEGIIPSEGTIGWADCESMVKASKNHDSFATFIDAWGQAEYIAENFLINGRPCFNEKAYKILVDQGHQELADRFFYNQPEEAFKMRLKGPSEDAQAVIDQFNEIFGA